MVGRRPDGAEVADASSTALIRASHGNASAVRRQRFCTYPLHDAQINIQSFFANVYGCVVPADNPTFYNGNYRSFRLPRADGRRFYDGR